MKKLYRKGTVHPSPPIISDHLSFLPATILTLTAALSPEDREVLAYLISSSNNNISVNSQRKNTHHQNQNQNQKSVSFAKSKSSGAGSTSNSNDHPPLFNCDCFRCYMSYWVRWDASPNRQLIHEIIDAFEDELLHNNKKMKNNKKDKKKKGGKEDNSGQLKRPSTDHQLSLGKDQLAESVSLEETTSSKDGDKGCDSHDEGEERSSVRSFVSFIGERIWGVWG